MMSMYEHPCFRVYNTRQRFLDCWCYIVSSSSIHIYSDNNSMELSPSHKDTNCAATQEPHSISCNPKVHYHVHKSPPLVPIISQTNTVHTTTTYLSQTHLSIIHPPTSSSS
jgi:hypothetical protein